MSIFGIQRFAFVSALVLLGASAAVASSIPVAPFPHIPTPNGGVASSIPVAPFPHIPTPNGGVVS